MDAEPAPGSRWRSTNRKHRGQRFVVVHRTKSQVELQRAGRGSKPPNWARLFMPIAMFKVKFTME